MTWFTHMNLGATRWVPRHGLRYYSLPCDSSEDSSLQRHLWWMPPGRKASRNSDSQRTVLNIVRFTEHWRCSLRLCILSYRINLSSGADCDLCLTRILRPNDGLHDPFCSNLVFVLRERLWSNSWSHAYLCQNSFCNFRSADVPASPSGIVRHQLDSKFNILKDFADTNTLLEEMVRYASP